MKKADKVRVVLDTNLLISAIIATGTPYFLLEAWKDDMFNLISSMELLEEIKETSQKKYLQKYNRLPEKMDELIIVLRLAAEIVSPIQLEKLPIRCRDPKDDIVLAVALGGDADYLVTGDSDLLSLEGKPELGKLKIVKATDFLNLLHSGIN